MARTFEFNGAKLQAAIFEILQRRGTPYDRDSFKRIVALADDEDMQKRWKFLKTIKDDTLEFSVVITEIQTFLEPVFDAIVNGDDCQGNWNSISKIGLEDNIVIGRNINGYVIKEFKGSGSFGTVYSCEKMGWYML